MSYSDEDKRRIIENYNGGSVREYCSMTGISFSTFYKWKKEFEISNTQTFLELPSVKSYTNDEDSIGARSIKISMAGATLELDNDFDEALLRKVLKVLKSL